MAEYKIIGKKATMVDYVIIFGIVVHCLDNDTNYMFASYTEKNIGVAKLPKKDIKEKHNNWIYVGEFTQRDYETSKIFLDAIDEFFKNFDITDEEYHKSFKWYFKKNNEL